MKTTNAIAVAVFGFAVASAVMPVAFAAVVGVLAAARYVTLAQDE